MTRSSAACVFLLLITLVVPALSRKPCPPGDNDGDYTEGGEQAFYEYSDYIDGTLYPFLPCDVTFDMLPPTPSQSQPQSLAECLEPFRRRGWRPICVEFIDKTTEVYPGGPTWGFYSSSVIDCLATWEGNSSLPAVKQTYGFEYQETDACKYAWNDWLASANQFYCRTESVGKGILVFNPETGGKECSDACLKCPTREEAAEFAYGGSPLVGPKVPEDLLKDYNPKILEYNPDWNACYKNCSSDEIQPVCASVPNVLTPQKLYANECAFKCDEEYAPEEFKPTGLLTPPGFYTTSDLPFNCISFLLIGLLKRGRASYNGFCHQCPQGKPFPNEGLGPAAAVQAPASLPPSPNEGLAPSPAAGATQPAIPPATLPDSPSDITSANAPGASGDASTSPSGSTTSAGVGRKGVVVSVLTAVGAVILPMP